SLVVYDLFKINAAIDALWELHPEALENPRKPLEEYVAELVGYRDASVLYRETGRDPGQLNLETLDEHYDSWRRILGDGRILVEINPSTRSPGTVVGRLPSGVASSPEAPPDLILDNAIYLQGDDSTNDQVILSYVITGKTQDGFDLVMRDGFGMTNLDQGSIVALPVLSPTPIRIQGVDALPGLHELTIDLGQVYE